MKKVKKSSVSTPKSSSAPKKETVTSFDFKNIESQIETLITKNLPALPENVIETLVKLSPWLAILGTVMGIPAILALFRLNQFAAYYNVPGMGFGWSYQVHNVLFIVQMIIMALSIQGLFARKLSAWRLMYYAAWVSLLSSLLSSGIVSMLIGGLVSFYLLFQIKGSYRS